MWGVPTLAGTFGSDAIKPGWEMSTGVGTTSFLCALCGAETGSGMGLLQGSTLLYPEALVLDAELYHSVRKNVAGLDTIPDSMAIDVIKAVGPRGHYLGQRHTREFMHKLEHSQVVYQPDQVGGYKDAIEVAREKTDWILQNHHPEPLGELEQNELARILSAAEGELV